MPTCRECGSTVSEGDWFCRECGAELDESAAGSGSGAADDDWGDRPDDTRGNEPSDGLESAFESDAGREEPDRRGTDAAGSTAAETTTEDRGGQDDGSLHEEDTVTFAFKYPLSSGWRPVAISGLLLVFSWLIVPMFALAGYGYRISRAAALGRETAPVYEDWGGLLADGFRYTLVSAGLAIPYYLFLGGIVVAAEQSLWALLLAIPVYFGFAYVMPAFLVAFVATDSVTGAFTSGVATGYLKTVTYLKDYGIAIAISAILSFIPMVLLVTLIGWIWGYAYYGLAYAAYWGFAYYNAAEEGVVPPPEGAATPAEADAEVRTAPVAQD